MYVEIRSKRMAIVLLLGFFLTACADDFVGARKIQSSSACAAQGGEWASLAALFPNPDSTEADRHDFICNTRTHDAGKACTDRIGQCEGLCLAPEGAKIGQAAVGQCSTYMIVPYGTLKVGNGKVLDQQVQY